MPPSGWYRNSTFPPAAGILSLNSVMGCQGHELSYPQICGVKERGQSLPSRVFCFTGDRDM
jgi:hypothetical protein